LTYSDFVYLVLAGNGFLTQKDRTWENANLHV